jgi:hypothetical protein
MRRFPRRRDALTELTPLATASAAAAAAAATATATATAMSSSPTRLSRRGGVAAVGPDALRFEETCCVARTRWICDDQTRGLDRCRRVRSSRVTVPRRPTMTTNPPTRPSWRRVRHRLERSGYRCCASHGRRKLSAGLRQGPSLPRSRSRCQTPRPPRRRPSLHRHGWVHTARQAARSRRREGAVRRCRVLPDLAEVPVKHCSLAACTVTLSERAGALGTGQVEIEAWFLAHYMWPCSTSSAFVTVQVG